MFPGSGSSSAVYFPTVTFRTQRGEEITAEAKIGSNPPPGRVGRQVQVLYDPANPVNFRIDSVLGRGGCLGPAFAFIGGLLVIAAVAIIVLASSVTLR